MKNRLRQLWFIRFCLTSAMVLLTACASVPQAPVRGVTALTEHVTEGGQSFSLAYMPDADRVSLNVIWPNDYAHASGMPSVSTLGVELISSGGAGARTARQIKQDMTALGSAASLIATPDHIYGTFSSSPETLDETISIVRDVIGAPFLDELRLDVIKDAKRKRIEAQQNQQSAMLWSAARKFLLGDSTLTDYWNNTPVNPIITSVSKADIDQWHEETFTRQGVTVAVAGSIEAPMAAEVVDELLSSLPATRTVGSAPVQALVVPPLNKGATVLLHDESAPLTLIAAIGLLPVSREGGEVADIVAVSALGKGKDSRLVIAGADALTETDTVSASIANFSRLIRVFGINASVDHDSAADAFRLIEETYTEFKKASLDDQEVLRGVVPFASSLRSNEKNPDLIAYGLGQLILDDLPQELLLTVIPDSVALKADEINQRITDRYPDWEDMIKVVLSSDLDVIDADCVVESIEEIVDC